MDKEQTLIYGIRSVKEAIESRNRLCININVDF